MNIITSQAPEYCQVPCVDRVGNVLALDGVQGSAQVEINFFKSICRDAHYFFSSGMSLQGSENCEFSIFLQLLQSLKHFLLPYGGAFLGNISQLFRNACEHLGCNASDVSVTPVEDVVHEMTTAIGVASYRENMAMNFSSCSSNIGNLWRDIQCAVLGKYDIEMTEDISALVSVIGQSSCEEDKMVAYNILRDALNVLCETKIELMHQVAHYDKGALVKNEMCHFDGDCFTSGVMEDIFVQSQA